MIYDPETFETTATEDTLKEIIGEDVLRDLQEIHPPTYRHMMRVGELTRQLFEQRQFSKNIQLLGAVCGGLHDFGKFNSEVLDLIDNHHDIGEHGRVKVRRLHTSIGFSALTRYAEEKDDHALSVASFTALHHHDRYDESKDYRHSGPGCHWGITRTVMAFDVLDALSDKSRGYVTAREGRLSPERIYDIATQAIGGREPHVALLHRHIPVGVMPALQQHLGLASTLDT